jgi:hypothetical protein
MNKIEEIFKAWGIMFNPNDSQTELAGIRMKICDVCEYKKTNPIIHCGECGCALKAKVYTPVIGGCPKGKWTAAEMEWTARRNAERNKENYEKLKKG